jgi:hypothetical protein
VLTTRPKARCFLRILVVSMAGAVGSAASAEAQTVGTREPIAQVPGRIVDVSADRILYLQGDPPDNQEGPHTLKVRTRASGQDTTVPSVAPRYPQYGFLTAHGVVFMAMAGDALTARLFEWRDGRMLDLGFPNSAQSLVVKGRYGIWNAGPSTAQPRWPLFRRDFALGTTLQPAADAGNIDNDVSEDGQVVYWSAPQFGEPSPNQYDIFRWRNGRTEQLTNDSDAVLWNTDPLTDGVNVVYSKHSPCCTEERGSVAVFTSAGEVVLDSFRDDWPVSHLDYQAAGGWVAFTRLGSNDELEVWTRSPQGIETRISPVGKPARIIDLNRLGEVMFADWSHRGGVVPPGHLYLGRPGKPPIDFGGPVRGTDRVGHPNFVFWQAGQWFEAFGGTLYRLDPDPRRPLFGKTTVGSAFGLLDHNDKYGSRYYLLTARPVTVTKLRAYLDGRGRTSGSQVLRGLIYKNTSTGPGALVARTFQVTLSAGTPPGWVDLYFPYPPRLQAGGYWLTLHAGESENIVRYAFDVKSGGQRYNDDLFSNGPLNPFGGSNRAAREMSIHAVGR